MLGSLDEDGLFGDFGEIDIVGEIDDVEVFGSGDIENDIFGDSRDTF